MCARGCSFRWSRAFSASSCLTRADAVKAADVSAETAVHEGDPRSAIVPGATHLFEERGALEQVAKLAADWCRRYLRKEAL